MRRHALALATALAVAASAIAAPAVAEIAVREVGALEARTAALLYSGQQAGDLEARLAATAMPGDGSVARVAWVLEVAGAPLAAALAMAGERPEEESRERPAPPRRLELYVYALDAEGRLGDSRAQALELSPDAVAELPRRGLQVLGDLDLVPGDYDLRYLLLERRSGRLALGSHPLAVGAAEAGWPGSPLAPWPADAGWTRVHAERHGPALPLTAGGDRAFPTALVVATATKATRLYLPSPQPAAVAEMAEWTAEVTGAEESATVPLELDPATAVRPVSGQGTTEGRVRPARLDLAGVSPGRYRLTLTAPSGRRHDLALWVAPAVLADAGPPTWPELLAGSIAAPPPPVADPEVEPASASLLATARAYRQALERRQAGDRAAAIAAMSELERAAVAREVREPLADLEAAEVAVVQQVGLVAIDGLLPLVELHLLLFEEYHSAGNYLLATHSRGLAVRIAELYARESADPQAGRRVAGMLIGLGGYLQELGSTLQAEAVYLKALEHHPDAVAALGMVAAIRESYADYPAAIEALDRLREVGGLAPEDALRRGINLRRVGKTRQAAATLRELAAATPPTWVSAVASQELASILVAEERPAAAREVLVSAVARHPEVPRLRLQLAALLDRLGEPQQALATLATVGVAAPEVGSPRLRYSELPTAGLARERRQLAAAVEERLPPVLARLDQLLGAPGT